MPSLIQRTPPAKRTPLGAVSLNSPSSRQKTKGSAEPKSRPAQTPQFDRRLSSLSIYLQAGQAETTSRACSELLAMLQDAVQLTASQSAVLAGRLRTVLEAAPVADGPLCALLTHVLSKCGDAFGELLGPACAVLCQQAELALAASFTAIIRDGHPAIAEDSLRMLLERAASPEHATPAVQAGAAAAIEHVLAVWPDAALRRVSAPLCDAMLGEPALSKKRASGAAAAPWSHHRVATHDHGPLFCVICLLQACRG